jgi:uncharacterized protein (DUF1501 family)
MDISDESAATQALYGIDEQATDEFGRQCLLARRFVEAGVRFVEITSGGWDHHRTLKESLTNKTQSIDKPIAGLLQDLKDRDLLKDTLVIWGGEFGRTPTSEGVGKPGRDHNPYGFSMWLSGAGIKGGQAIGATDELGFRAVEERSHISDLHATILHLLGLDHTRLTFFYQGLNQRLTGVRGNVIQKVMA